LTSQDDVFLYLPDCVHEPELLSVLCDCRLRLIDVESQYRSQPMPRLVSGKCYRGNDALVPDAALTRKSLENSPVPKETVPLESSVPDDEVPGFDPPLV